MSRSDSPAPGPGRDGPDSPQPGICERYEAIADWFAANRLVVEPPMEQAYLTAVLADLPPGAPVLDLGCGTGEPLAGACIRAGHPVVGVDGAPGMIARCRQRFPDMTWICRDMRGLFLGRTFGAILAWDSFFHLNQDDQRAMFAVFAAHAGPGGLLLFTTGPRYGEAVGVMDGVSFDHFSLDPWEYRALLAGHGFRVLRHVVEDPDCGGHTVWLAAKGPAAP